MTKDEALKMAVIVLCIFLAGCDAAHTKCVNGKYYIKWCDECQYILEKNVECLNEQTN